MMVVDAPGGVLFALAFSVALFVGASLWTVSRSPIVAVVVGPVIAAFVGFTEESAPTRVDWFAIVAISSIGATAAALALAYARWLIRMLRLRPPDGF